MKTYRVPSSATEWSPSGTPQTVTRLESVTSVDSHSYQLPVQLTLKAETTRKGVRRVVLQAGTEIPGSVLNDMVSGINVDPKGKTPVSAHLVVQGPQLAFMGEAGQLQSQGFLDLVLGRLVSDIIAVAADESVSSSADHHNLDGLLARALIGSAELDVVSGKYGSETAS